MRVSPTQPDDGPCRGAIEALAGLPIRPSTARQAFAILVAGLAPAGLAPSSAEPGSPAGAEIDPGWALARSRRGGADPAEILIDRPWWSAREPSAAATEALGRLWRNAVAVALAARRLAREAGDPDPDQVARAGLLHPLGLWALAVVDPGRLIRWLAADRATRATLEQRWLGTDLAALGRRLAERWGCDPLVVDAAWLHADAAGDLDGCAHEPTRLGFIRQAYLRAQRTPWTLDPDRPPDLGPPEASIRALTAEAQARTSDPFVAPDASAREEALTRDNLRLRRQLAAAEAAHASATRLAASLAASHPADPPQVWADRVAGAWAQEPGVARAAVAWRGDPGEAAARSAGDAPPTRVIPLGDRDCPAADLLIWEATEADRFAPSPALLAGWDGWARLMADREQLAERLDRAVSGLRGRVGRDEAARRRDQADALADFAAGAGHELNNPLAVIMGRAQLVLASAPDAEAARSLRAIIAQAQRAHRILRDLMFVARPGVPRPRACQPDEVVRASLRDLQDEAEAQGVHLALDAREPAPLVWADPEPLRQVADILARNALEASSSGMTVQFSTGADARQIRWTVHHAGRGITPAEGAHLFNPFFCGRQAGRGLGLGLPRAARIVEQAGGSIRWNSGSGQGATFQVTLPIREIPGPAPLERGPEDAIASPR